MFWGSKHLLKTSVFRCFRCVPRRFFFTCPRKLGSMVSKRVISPAYKWGTLGLWPTSYWPFTNLLEHPTRDPLTSYLWRMVSWNLNTMCFVWVIEHLFIIIWECDWMAIPIASTYGIFTYIDHKHHLNVGKYTIHGSYGYMVENLFFFAVWVQLDG